MSSDFKHIQIFILCKDRPEYFSQVVKSALSQIITKYSYEVIVSDNSITNSIYHLYRTEFSKFTNIRYVRRHPSLSALKHFEIAFSEADADYVTFFHDDDLLFPHYASTMADLLTKYNDVISIACNAMEVNGDVTNIRRVSFPFLRMKFFCNKKSFLNQYLPGNGGLPPFSGYMFRLNSFSSNIFSNPDAGKHSDATILAKIIKFGRILWIPKILMCYRYHQQSDSSVENIKDRRLLLEFMYSSGINRFDLSVVFYRIIYISNILNQKSRIYHKVKFYKYKRLFICKIIFRYYFWRMIFFRQLTRSLPFFNQILNHHIRDDLKKLSQY